MNFFKSKLPNNLCYASAIGWFKFKGNLFPIFPLRSIKFIFYGALLFFILLHFTDWGMEKACHKGLLNCPDWVKEEKTRSWMALRRFQSDFQNPIWQSKGIPLLPKSPEKKRILIIGDSFVYGSGHVNINELWWRQLQIELEKRGYLDVEVIAAGANGASTQQQLNWIKKLGIIEKVSPDMILFGYVANDPEVKQKSGESYVNQRIFPELDIPFNVLDFYENITLALNSLYKDKLSTFQENNSTGYNYRDWELKLLEGKNFAAYKSIINELGIEINSKKIPAAFVTLPYRPYRDMSTRYSPIKPLILSEGIGWHDLDPKFQQNFKNKSVSTLFWAANPANGHPANITNRFYALETLDFLEKDYPFVLGKKQQPKSYSPKINDWLPDGLDVKISDTDSWLIKYPPEEEDVLFLPVNEPHVAISFERPVSINSIKIEGENSTSTNLWITAIDQSGYYDSPKYIFIGNFKGANGIIKFESPHNKRLITSLRLSRENPKYSVSEKLSSLEFRHELNREYIFQNRGLMYSYGMTDLSEKSNNSQFKNRSPYILYEDGRPMIATHANHESIATIGKGLYSFWGGSILFSSSDGSDPRTNKHKYTLGIPPSEKVKLNIDFNNISKLQ